MIYKCTKIYDPIDCGEDKVFAIGTGDFRPGGISCMIFILNGKVNGKTIDSDRELNLEKGGEDYRKKGTDPNQEKESFWTEI